MPVFAIFPRANIRSVLIDSLSNRTSGRPESPSAKNIVTHTGRVFVIFGLDSVIHTSPCLSRIWFRPEQRKNKRFKRHDSTSIT
jgi:hypothetical protein